MSPPARNGAANSSLVYSTGVGRICPLCRQAAADCRCKSAAAPMGDGNVRVSRETGGRGGKTVTIVRGLALDAASVAVLGKRLKAACGTGGTVKDGVVEIQGDHVDRVIGLLHDGGHRVKRSGG